MSYPRYLVKKIKEKKNDRPNPSPSKMKKDEPNFSRQVGHKSKAFNKIMSSTKESGLAASLKTSI